MLYGGVDPLTHEWSDGVLARIVREAALDEASPLHWITLDGPVDAVWVENLNTVLDDNKKLCLPSGEIIKFHSRMTMVFEVADLQEASPATVSRCGMVHLTPEKLGWRVQVKPWLTDLPASLTADWRAGMITGLIERVVPSALEWLSDSSCLLHPTVSANWLVRSFLNLLEALLLKEHTRASLADKEQEERDKKEAKEAAARLGAAQNTGLPARDKPVAASTLATLAQGPGARREAEQRAKR
jgi:dynein heavy chain